MSRLPCIILQDINFFPFISIGLGSKAIPSLQAGSADSTDMIIIAMNISWESRRKRKLEPWIMFSVLTDC